MNIALFAILIAGGFLVAVMSAAASLTAATFADHDANQTSTATPSELASQTNNTETAASENRVAVGGGNATVQHYTFFPQTVEVDPGESVTWFSPSEFNEFHTVTFLRNQALVSDIILPFSIQDQEQLELVQPFNVGEAITVETMNGTTVIAVNKLAFYPAVASNDGSTIEYLNGTDIQYTMNGTEGAVNSGIIQLPVPVFAPNTTVSGPPTTINSSAGSIEQQTSAEESLMSWPPFPFVNSFAITFEDPGTYDYFCALHPWMTGQVVVRGENQTTVSGPMASQ
ncbi:MAG: hypothetical protein MN733_18265 [Nitrososphaera sp.]|nr:hypothetical protein [Nitrososphaera sp.]